MASHGHQTLTLQCWHSGRDEQAEGEAGGYKGPLKNIPIFLRIQNSTVHDILTKSVSYKITSRKNSKTVST